MASSHPGQTDLNAAQEAVRGITRMSVAVALILIGLKAFAWGATGSVAILASLVDSGLDLAASLITFFAVRWAAAPPDAEHRFGHGKAEAFASLVQAGLVFTSAGIIGWEAIDHMLNPRVITAGAWGVGVMAISIALTGALVFAQTQALKKTKSVAVSGDRAHYFSDLASNAVALIGVGSATLLNAPGLDAAAGFIVAVWLIWGALAVLKDAADHLLDRALSEGAVDEIRALAVDDPRVLGVHQLRTRVSGQVVMIQMHMDLEPSLTLEQAHEIVVAAEKRILEQYPAADLIIHPDPRGRAEPHGGAFGEAGVA
ncbi:cation diffusion facilitator family transporter [Brevundimonas sp. 2R-24]|uniref:Cation diffusion facilitator family transporter n=1 Tax=Peiella sedimenti TaxID=3061083 RepID=A0ABT8SHN0_9CAUL|nr:cation diffusion facilitator family transporter [Caulobacteraceae bacterium XZ-24]